MKKITFMLAAIVASTQLTFAQGAKNIKLNEVLTDNETSLQDEFGQHLPWVELANTSFTTYNVRGMFITTDRSVLDKSLTAPQRIERMSIIPNEEPRTLMTGRQHLVLFLNSNPARGALHLDATVEPGTPLWIALYDGNGIDLIDSVSVPALGIDKSFARIKDGYMRWDIKAPEAVTPGIGNYIEVNESKIARLKREDPHGFGITVLSMGIVFFCLALLYVFFSILGKIMTRKQKEKKPVDRQANWKKTARHPIAVTEAKKREPTREEYMVVIAMALKQYMDNAHDDESGVITIRQHETRWHGESSFGTAGLQGQKGHHIPTGNNI